MVTEILLASYNGEKYIGQLVESLLAQTEKDVTVTCRDDGSTDNTLHILEKYNIKPIKGFPTGTPKGNFMELLKGCKGAYLFFADQDDVWEKDKVKQLLAVMKQGEKTYGKDTPLLVHCDIAVTDEEGNTKHPSMFAHQQWNYHANTLPRLLVQNNVTGCAMCINRSLRDLLLKAKAEDMFMHDWWAAMTAAAFGHILFVNAPLVRYRQHGQNQVGASSASMFARAKKALFQMKKGKDRVALTYANAERFFKTYQDILPADGKQCIITFLAIPQKSKLFRIRALQKGNYKMQSTTTRLGHIFFS